MKKVFTHMLISRKSIRFLPWLGGMCLFVFTIFLVHAQERALPGAVKDEDGQPLSCTRADANGIILHSFIIEKYELNQI
jgi:hypothetical protein